MNAMITQLDIHTHKRYLLKVLLAISRDRILSRNLVFKWGTALLLFYGLDRFSTDLDFDLIDSHTSGEEVLERLKKVLQGFGKTKDLQIKRYTIFGLLSYGEIDYNIKIEINRRGLSWDYNAKNILWIEMNVMNREDISANKFFTLLARKQMANRDIYDVWFILENDYEINKKLLEEKTGISFQQYIEKMLVLLEWLWNNYNILDGLGLVLNEKRKNFVKNNLLQEVIFLLKAHIV